MLGRVNVLITNYEQILSATDELGSFEFGAVILDEAHRVRNLSARVTKAVRQIKSPTIWALTGTPIERDQKDLLTLLSTLAPYQFSTEARGSISMEALRARARPFILRRMKRDVLNDLPDLLEVHQTLDLLPNQKRSYQRIIDDLKKRPNSQTLAVLNELRTICDYDDATGESSKVVRITEIIESIAAKGEKAVVFSFLLKPLDLLKSAIGRQLGSDTVVELRGDQSHEYRSDALESFKNDDKKCVLLGSSRVAGEGLTLTEANHVLFFNRWWNPSSNAQARDRVLRIGQKRDVTMYTFTCADTIETTIEEILNTKDGITLDLIDRSSDNNTRNVEFTNQLIDALT